MLFFSTIESITPSFHLSVCLSVNLPISSFFLFVYFSICLSVPLPNYLSAHLFIHPLSLCSFIHLFIYPFFRFPFVYLFPCPCVFLSIYTRVSMYICLFLDALKLLNVAERERERDKMCFVCVCVLYKETTCHD